MRFGYPLGRTQKPAPRLLDRWRFSPDAFAFPRRYSHRSASSERLQASPAGGRLAYCQKHHRWRCSSVRPGFLPIRCFCYHHTQRSAQTPPYAGRHHHTWLIPRRYSSLHYCSSSCTWFDIRQKAYTLTLHSFLY